MEPVTVISGAVSVLDRADVDTDQIIPAQYLNLVPTIPEEYEKLGSYALCGLPEPAACVAQAECLSSAHKQRPSTMQWNPPS